MQSVREVWPKQLVGADWAATKSEAVHTRLGRSARGPLEGRWSKVCGPNRKRFWCRRRPGGAPLLSSATPGGIIRSAYSQSSKPGAMDDAELLTLDDFHVRAASRLPRMVYDYYAGGAETEW
jgi:hypothetical protein